MEGLKIGDMFDTFNLVVDEEDVSSINRQFSTDYDGFYVLFGEGEHDCVYGFYGAVPYLHKQVFHVK